MKTMTNTQTSPETRHVPQTTQEGRSHYVTPAVDLYETNEAFVLAADVPGATAEGVDLRVDHGNLMLEVKSSHTPAPGMRHMAPETVYKRQFALGRGLAQEGIQAKLQHGVLTVTLPKVPERQPRQIEVQH